MNNNLDLGLKSLNEIKLRMRYDLSKTLTENLISEQPDSKMPFQPEKFGYNPNKPSTLEPALQKQEDVFRSLSELNTHDWLQLIELTTGIFGVIPTPLSPFLLGISTLAGVSDAYTYYTEGDKYMAMMTFVLSVIPGGELKNIIKNSKVLGKRTTKEFTSLISKYKSGKKLLKSEADDLTKLGKEMAENAPQINKVISKNLAQTLLANLSKKSPKFLINLILILKKIGVIKLSEISLKIGGLVYGFDKLYLFVFRDLIPNQKDLDQRTKNELRASINHLLGYEKEVNEFLLITAKEGLEKTLKDNKGQGVNVDVKETPEQLFQEILKQESEKIKKSSPKLSQTPAPSFESVLSGKSIIKKGQVGDSVKKVQTMLYDLGYDHLLTNFDTYKNWNDGNFGNFTQDAVETFQEDNSLNIDGKVGKDTLTKLIDIYKQSEKNENGKTINK